MNHKQSQKQNIYIHIASVRSTATYIYYTSLMASFIKSPVRMTSQAALLLLLIALVVQTQSNAQRQSCSSELSTLNVCAPFVVPGNNGNPSSECCGALQAVEHDCLCSTLRIASQLPTRCNIPSTSCGLCLLFSFSTFFCSN